MHKGVDNMDYSYFHVNPFKLDFGVPQKQETPWLRGICKTWTRLLEGTGTNV